MNELPMYHADTYEVVGQMRPFDAQLTLVLGRHTGGGPPGAGRHQMSLLAARLIGMLVTLGFGSIDN